jgi:hypothetical protein
MQNPTKLYQHIPYCSCKECNETYWNASWSTQNLTYILLQNVALVEEARLAEKILATITDRHKLKYNKQLTMINISNIVTC